MSLWGTTQWRIVENRCYKSILNLKVMTIILLMVLLPHLEVMKFVNFDGKRYSHIINLTGYPATGLCSVTIIGPNAEQPMD
jgi:hypothetical protein